MKEKKSGCLQLIIIAFAIIGAFAAFYMMFKFISWSDDSGIPVNTEEVNAENPGKRELSVNMFIDNPEKIYNSDIMLFRVKYDLPAEKSRSIYSDGVRYHSGNIIFYSKNEDKWSLLFDKPVIINYINFPQERKDSLQDFILYYGIVSDTDKDGYLRDGDNNVVFISDTDGSGLQQITPDSLNYTDIEISYDYKDMYISLKGKKDERFLMWFDLGNREIIHNNTLDSLLEKSKMIMRNLNQQK